MPPVHNSTKVFVDGALFSSNGKLLLLQRLDRVWELPCGTLDFGEEPEIGIGRVFLELTGIDVSPDSPLGAWSALTASGDSHLHEVHIGYAVTLSAALLAVELDSAKHTSFAWILPAELPSTIDSPQMRKACERAFANLARSRKKPRE
jgi:ADP-ribose pyrophosphatase YjhB (NUDIX family)